MVLLKRELYRRVKGPDCPRLSTLEPTSCGEDTQSGIFGCS
jgi:hypothetical protein